MAGNPDAIVPGRGGDGGQSLLQDDEDEEEQQQSQELRVQLEQFLEHVQRQAHAESVAVLEERYLVLISSYPERCLQRAVLLSRSSRVLSSEGGAAAVSSATAASSLRLLIHFACDKNAPSSIIRSLLHADTTIGRRSLSTPDDWGDLPIHIACSRAATALHRADTDYYLDQQRRHQNENENENHNPSFHSLHRRTILRNNNGDDTANGNNENDTDIATVHGESSNTTTNYHTSSRRNEGVEIVRLLLAADADKTTLYVKDRYESLPIHTAARYNAPVEVMELLLKHDRNLTSSGKIQQSTLYTKGYHGQYPLMVACRSGNPSWPVLAVLLRYDRGNQYRTVFATDTAGRLPIHVLVLRTTCPHCVYLVLKTMVVGRSTSRSWARWKYDLSTTILTALTTVYERDFTTRDKLEIIATEFRRLYDIGLVLELLVWKLSCLVGLRDQTTSTSMTHHEEDEHVPRPLDDLIRSILTTRTTSPPLMASATTTTTTTHQFKQNRRIVSHAEMIVPHIISFIEEEPIRCILEKFNAYGYIPGGLDEDFFGKAKLIPVDFKTQQ